MYLVSFIEHDLLFLLASIFAKLNSAHAINYCDPADNDVSKEDHDVSKEDAV